MKRIIPLLLLLSSFAFGLSGSNPNPPICMKDQYGQIVVFDRIVYEPNYFFPNANVEDFVPRGYPDKYTWRHTSKTGYAYTAIQVFNGRDRHGTWGYYAEANIAVGRVATGYTSCSQYLADNPPEPECDPTTEDEINGVCVEKCPTGSTRDSDFICVCNNPDETFTNAGCFPYLITDSNLDENKEGLCRYSDGATQHNYLHHTGSLVAVIYHPTKGYDLDTRLCGGVVPPISPTPLEQIIDSVFVFGEKVLTHAVAGWFSFLATPVIQGLEILDGNIPPSFQEVQFHLAHRLWGEDSSKPVGVSQMHNDFFEITFVDGVSTSANVQQVNPSSSTPPASASQGGGSQEFWDFIKDVQSKKSDPVVAHIPALNEYVIETSHDVTFVKDIGTHYESLTLSKQDLQNAVSTAVPFKEPYSLWRDPEFLRNLNFVKTKWDKGVEITNWGQSVYREAKKEVGTFDPISGETTKTDTATGGTITTPPSVGGITNPDGTSGGSLDLSGIQAQLAKANASLDGIKGSLDGIDGTLKSGFGDMGKDLKGIKGGIDGLNDKMSLNNALLTGIDGKLGEINNATADDVTNPIDNALLDTIFDTFQTAWTNLKADIDSVSTMGESVRDTISNGFTLSLPSSPVTSCPYNVVLDFYYFPPKDISIDFCRVFSPVHSVFYPLFYLILTASVLSLAFLSLRRMF